MGQPAQVAYVTPAAQGGAAPVTVVCNPSSGSAFAPGTHTVTCTATDQLSRQATCTFRIVINRLPQLQQTRFVAFGDSITAGVYSPAPSVLQTLAEVDSYPYKLRNLLSARYGDQTITVTNEGLPGESAVQGTSRLPDVLRRHNPEVLLLLEGANDLLALRERALSDIIESLETMTRYARSRGLRVFLANHPPQRPGTQRGVAAHLIVPLNEQIAVVASREGAHLVDLYRAFGTDTSATIGVDGLHPTQRGYDLMAETFYQAIRATLELASPTAGTAFAAFPD
jgi:lysophospholipase L1-like esterase